MMRYEHTQRAYAIHWITAPLFLVAVAGILSGGARLSGWVVIAVAGVVFAWLAATFSMLTVIVEGDQVRLYFGRGWPRKSIDLREVASVGRVRNRWWHGLGIWWIPGGALWNVWGLDAVELRSSSGRLFRIGTDDAEALLAAVAR